MESKQPTATEYHNLAVKYFNQEDFESAINELYQAIQTYPSDYSLYMLRARCYSNMDNYQSALVDSDKAIGFFQNSDKTIDLVQKSDAYFNRANIHFFAKKYEDSVTDYSKAIELDPNSDAYFNCATAHLFLGKPELALEEYKEMLLNKAIETFKGNDIRDSFLFAGNLAVETKSYNEAREFFEFAFQSAPDEECVYKPWLLKSVDHPEDIEQVRQKLEEANNKLRELVQSTSHTAGNLLRPNTQAKIAKKLKGTDFSEESKKLYYASSDIKYVKQQFKLLEIMQSLTGNEVIMNQLKLDQVDENDSQSMSIENILNLAAFRAIDKFFDLNEYSLNFARDTLEKKNANYSKLAELYQDYVLSSDGGLSVISWCSEFLRPIIINYACNDWKKLYFHKDSQTAALFFCYFFELFFNAFKYADHNQDEFLTITLGRELYNDIDFLTMNWGNPRSCQESFGSNKGLKLSASYISLLNDVSYKNNSQEIITDDVNMFKLVTRVNRKIFNL